MNRIDSSQFESLLLASTPLIDVRAPVEFAEGAIPGAVNLPLLTDSERHVIGLTYKTEGQDSAIRLGHELVSGEVRQTRVRQWAAKVSSSPEAVIYCFRGGLRSQIVQSWLKESGIERPIVAGGYKALRRYLSSALESAVARIQFEVVCGPTGSGKTKFLKDSGRPYLDLEALACHRGSAFGALPGGQPTQIDFENALAVELLRLKNVDGVVLIEDESRMIGRRHLPETIFIRKKQSKRLLLEIPLETRVENIFVDYILDSSLGTVGDIKRFAEFRAAVQAISRKLGGLRAQEVLGDLTAAEAEFCAGRGLDSNRIWIRKLLIWYYDPLYRLSSQRSAKS